MCEGLAEQANCALIYSSEGVKLVCLQVAPTTEVLTIPALSRITETLKISSEGNQDLYTKLTMEWQADLSLEKPKILKLESNISDFGTKEQDYTNTIYNQSVCVQSTFDFKSNRVSNLWKTSRYLLPLKYFGLEVFDVITDGTFKAVVQSIETNWLEGTINLSVLTLIKFGTAVESADFWEPVSEITAQTNPLTGREVLPDFIAEQLDEGVAKHTVMGTSDNGTGGSNPPEDNPDGVAVFLAKVNSVNSTAGTVNVSIFNSSGGYSNTVDAKASIISGTLATAKPILVAGTIVFVTGNAAWSTDGSTKQDDYWIIDVFHEGGSGDATIWATVTQTVAAGSTTTYKATLDDTPTTEVTISKIKNLSSTVDFTNYIPRFAVGQALPLMLVGTDYLIDETFTHIGSTTRSLTWNTADGRAMAVWA